MRYGPSGEAEPNASDASGVSASASGGNGARAPIARNLDRAARHPERCDESA